MSWLYSLSRFAAPIRPHFSTVIDISSSFACLLAICGSVTISYRLRPLLHQPRSLGCEEFLLLPLRIPYYSSAVIFGVPHPAFAQRRWQRPPFVSSAFCAVDSHAVATFRPLSFVAVFLPRSRAFAAKTLYGPCYLLRDRYYTARFTSRRRAWLAHYRELLAQIGRVSQTFTYAVVPGAVFIVPSLGQVDKLPAFLASCHRDGHSVVRNASSWPSVSRWDYMLIKHIHRVSARRGIAHLFGCSTSRGGGHPATASL
ncbi:hypothetical protein EDB89DRAFT_2197605 [Lactarius sanguifluus]|nr:hypothetical protein EDB89DRAFT_2197605 [Lactarius sanguifluus]